MHGTAFINGKIYIQRDTFVSALLAENGRITQIGDDKSILAAAGKDAEIVDCGGKTVIPGLNDSHMHLLMVGRAMERADITGCGGPGRMPAKWRVKHGSAWMSSPSRRAITITARSMNMMRRGTGSLSGTTGWTDSKSPAGPDMMRFIRCSMRRTS